MAKHKTGTRKEWLTERLELLQAEKELTRRSDELAQASAGAAVGPGGEGVPVRDRGGERLAEGSLPGTLAAPRLPFHVRARLHGRVSVVLVDRRWVQRHRRPPGQPRRHADGSVAGARWRSCRPTGGGWGGPFPGRRRSAATSTTTSTSGSPSNSSARVESSTTTGARARGSRAASDSALAADRGLDRNRRRDLRRARGRA